jgi:hypothetical protein
MTTVYASGITTTPSGNFLLASRSSTKVKNNGGGILCWLNSEPEFSMFRDMIYKANFQDYLNNLDENLTVFIPPNSSMIKHLDKLKIQNPRLFVGGHILGNRIGRCDFQGDLFETNDFFRNTSIIDDRQCIPLYGKSDYDLAFTLEWRTKAQIGDMDIECVNGNIFIISDPIFPC